MSLDLDLYLQSPVGTTKLLRSRLSRLSSLPQGETLNQPLSFYRPHPYPYFMSYSSDMLCVPLLGWIETTSQTCTSGVTFAKVEGGRESCPVRITRTLSVNDDFSWNVVAVGKRLSSTSDLLSTMPQSVSCVRDVLLVIEFLDSLVPCPGNEDKKFLPLITSRNGSFPSASGEYTHVCAFLVSSCTCTCTMCFACKYIHDIIVHVYVVATTCSI